MRSMVEGDSDWAMRKWEAPSTGFAGPPPRAGEDLRGAPITATPFAR